MPTKHDQHIVVIKLGGSVLTDLPAYAQCGQWLGQRLRRRPSERLVVVVSAPLGRTDELLTLAEQCCPSPEPGALDLLWSTGELYSVAVLTLCLQRAGVGAIGLGVHETGLTRTDGGSGGADVRLYSLTLLSHLRHRPVVVVPGFFARGSDDRVVSLGRGGSDFSAVVLAAGLGARRCELIKDVPGYFDRDPNRCATAVQLASVTIEEALRMAETGCDLVQERALLQAANSRLPLLVRSLDDSAPQTLVTVDGTEEQVQVLRAAV